MGENLGDQPQERIFVSSFFWFIGPFLLKQIYLTSCRTRAVKDCQVVAVIKHICGWWAWDHYFSANSDLARANRTYMYNNTQERTEQPVRDHLPCNLGQTCCIQWQNMVDSKFKWLVTNDYLANFFKLFLAKLTNSFFISWIRKRHDICQNVYTSRLWTDHISPVKV